MKNFLKLLTIAVVSVSASTVFAAEERTVPVTIDSDPQGAVFSFEVPNNKFVVTGTTPARINNVPTGKAIVHFETLENCIAPKPQNRTLGTDRPMNFFGRYSCGGATVQPDITEKPNVVPAKRVSIRLSPHQLEFINGDMVNYTLAVHNDADALNAPLNVDLRFDPNQLQVGTSLPIGATLVSAGHLQWRIDALAYNQTWSVPVSLRIGNVQGDSVRATASVQGAGVSTVNATATIGTPSLPETGFAADMLMILLSLALVSPLALRRLQGARA